MTGSGSGGSDFWSRRKAAVREEEELERAEKLAVKQAGERAALEEKTDAEILDELGLPDPDSLTEEDDFSRFLSAAVPDRLRRRALRKLWALNPVLANLDGLVDYAEDYSDAATVLSDMQTVYKVGKGMFDRLANLEDTETGPDAPAQGEGELQSENHGRLQCEEDAAAHNDFIQDGKASFQLTQGHNLVQSADEEGGPFDLQATALDEEIKEPQSKRRRMRFDYS